MTLRGMCASCGDMGKTEGARVICGHTEGNSVSCGDTEGTCTSCDGTKETCVSHGDNEGH